MALPGNRFAILSEVEPTTEELSASSYTTLLTEHGVGNDATFFLHGDANTIASVLNATERPREHDILDRVDEDGAPVVQPLTAAGNLTEGVLVTTIGSLWDRFFHDHIGQQFFVRMEGRVFLLTICMDADGDLGIDFVRDITSRDVVRARHNFTTGIEAWFTAHVIKDLGGSAINVFFTYDRIKTTVDKFFKPRWARDLPTAIADEIAMLNSETSRPPACWMHFLDAISAVIYKKWHDDNCNWKLKAGNVYKVFDLHTYRDVDKFATDAWRAYYGVCVTDMATAFPALGKPAKAPVITGGAGGGTKQRRRPGNVFALDIFGGSVRVADPVLGLQTSDIGAWADA